ncbi:hypothetical protein CLOM_g13924 [Closterium sp. NIES-68]|nr:hypothetical protein CLOM_g13924 [Closterium sp. NIES-68]GJP76797.1 hypothetical protein CLOP_g7257 [Closterium sp. NIES-67]
MLRNRETSQTYGATFVQQFANAEDDLDHSRASGGGAAGTGGSAGIGGAGGGGGGGRVTASGAIELSVRSGEKDDKDSDREAEGAPSSRSHHGKSRGADWTREVARDMGRDWNKEREWGRQPATSSAGGDRTAGGAAGNATGGAARDAAGDAGREKPRVVDDTLEDDDDSPADPEVLSRWKYGTPTSAWYATRFNKRRRNPWATGGHGAGGKSGRGGILSFSLSAVDLGLLLLLVLLLVYVHEQDHRACDVFIGDLEFLRKQLFHCRAESFDLKKQLNNAYRGRTWSAWQHCGASAAQMSAYYNYTPGSTCPPVTVSVTSGASVGYGAPGSGNQPHNPRISQPPQQQLQGESHQQQQQQQQQAQQQSDQQSGLQRQSWELPPSSRLDEALLFDARCLDLPRRACFSDSPFLSPSTAATTAAAAGAGAVGAAGAAGAADSGGAADGSGGEESVEPPSREAARWSNPEAKRIAWEMYGPCRDFECLMQQEDDAERAWGGGGGGGVGDERRGNAAGEGTVGGLEGAEAEGLEIGRLGLPPAVRGCLVSCFNLSRARERGARGAYGGYGGYAEGSGFNAQTTPTAPGGAAAGAAAIAGANAAGGGAAAEAVSLGWGMDAVLAVKAPGGIRVGLDIGGGTGNFAALMAERGVTVVTTASNHGAPVMEVLAHRALPALHLPLTARLPLFDSSLGLIHCAFWPSVLAHPPVLESALYDWDRVLRPGGLVWLERVPFSRPLIRKILAVAEVAQWKKVKWTKMGVGGSGGSGGGSGERGALLLYVLFEKPMKRVQEERRAIAVMS